MNALLKIIRILLTAVLLELTIFGCNSLVSKYVYGHIGGRFDPCEAIYSSIVYLSGVCHWQLSASYMGVMLVLTALVMAYYFLAASLLPHRMKVTYASEK